MKKKGRFLFLLHVFCIVGYAWGTVFADNAALRGICVLTTIIWSLSFGMNIAFYLCRKQIQFHKNEIKRIKSNENN